MEAEPVSSDEVHLEISYAFDNAILINKLRKRGAAMKYGKFEKADKYEG